jgi:hypothetical protein
MLIGEESRDAVVRSSASYPQIMRRRSDTTGWMYKSAYSMSLFKRRHQATVVTDSLKLLLTTRRFANDLDQDAMIHRLG